MAKLFSFIVAACLLLVLHAETVTDDGDVQSESNFTNALTNLDGSNLTLTPVDTTGACSRNNTKAHNFIDAAQRCADEIYMCVTKCPSRCQFITHRCIPERKMCFDICCCAPSKSLNKTCTSLDN